MYVQVPKYRHWGGDYGAQKPEHLEQVRVCVCQCVIAGEYLAWSLGSQILRTRRPRPNPGEVIGSGGQLRPTWLSVCLTEGEQGSGTDTGLSLCLWAVSPGIYSVCV